MHVGERGKPGKTRHLPLKFRKRPSLVTSVRCIVGLKGAWARHIWMRKFWQYFQLPESFTISKDYVLLGSYAFPKGKGEVKLWNRLVRNDDLPRVPTDWCEREPPTWCSGSQCSNSGWKYGVSSVDLENSAAKASHWHWKHSPVTSW